MLQNESVKRWLEGMEPAWTHLDHDSFGALRDPPSPMAGQIRLAADLTHDELDCSAVVRNAVALLHASTGLGLKLTATGNLSRAIVAEMYHQFTWPGFDRSTDFQFRKVINEPDFLPPHFVRHVAQTATLLRRHKGHLKISPAGRRVIEMPNIRALQAVLFHVVFWHFDLRQYRNLHWLILTTRPQNILKELPPPDWEQRARRHVLGWLPIGPLPVRQGVQRQFPLG